MGAVATVAYIESVNACRLRCFRGFDVLLGKRGALVQLHLEAGSQGTEMLTLPFLPNTEDVWCVEGDLEWPAPEAA